MHEGFALSNGARVPAVGFGTWELTPEDTAKEAVAAALKTGYRHIDTAKIYRNEHGVGTAIRESGVPREEIFVTTKLWNSDHGHDDALQAIDESLEKLGLDYVDLYLVHWPGDSVLDGSWTAMQEMYKSGKAKAIGVSNYSVQQLQELMNEGGTVPMVDQIEFHPYIYRRQKSILDFCKQNDILVEAYSPLKRTVNSSEAVVDHIARQHGVSTSQVILRWCLQHGTVPLPRSANPDHIRENLDVFGFELSDEDMVALNGLSGSYTQQDS